MKPSRRLDLIRNPRTDRIEAAQVYPNATTRSSFTSVFDLALVAVEIPPVKVSSFSVHKSTTKTPQSMVQRRESRRVLESSSFKVGKVNYVKPSRPTIHIQGQERRWWMMSYEMLVWITCKSRAKRKQNPIRDLYMLRKKFG